VTGKTLLQRGCCRSYVRFFLFFLLPIGLCGSTLLRSCVVFSFFRWSFFQGPFFFLFLEVLMKEVFCSFFLVLLPSPGKFSSRSLKVFPSECSVSRLWFQRQFSPNPPDTYGWAIPERAVQSQQPHFDRAPTILPVLALAGSEVF